MNEMTIIVVGLTWLGIATSMWLAWQLLRQNGRMLLRVEEIEKRLDELEFGEPGDEPSDEMQGRARHFVHAGAEFGESGAQGTDAPYPPDRSNRFNRRSVARSKIKRDGLKAGTPAPDFRLPRLDGRGELTLKELHGRRVLLVFSDPHCGPCNTLAPELEKFHRGQVDRDRSPVATHGHAKVLRALNQCDEDPSAADGDRPRSEGISVVMISRGEPKENRAKVKEHGLTFPVVLQQQWEISRRYAMFATPVAYLIDEEGVIIHDVATGVEPILALLANAGRQASEAELAALQLEPAPA